ncbi:MAG: phosphoenolpyruvate--protein phosphotransferase [Clostridiales bacterium]|nr:phosphoenolpyruvate--protein phosphotransferase [Clostridiales bacterium]MDU3239773.1 phosphoenolpyruvate--protein phosphotransferase [Clostridiales bacterium]
MKTIQVEKTSSKGIVMGRVFRKEDQDLSPECYAADNAVSEAEKYRAAVDEVINELEPLAAESDIFAAHLELAKDIALMEGVLDKIENGKENAQMALAHTAEEYCAIFECMEDEYMRERAADIKDIRNRLMRKLKGIPDDDYDGIREKVILVASDLAPSDTAKLNLDYILGFITELGGVTSHVSIMARSLGLPALVGVKGILEQASSGDFVIMDASEGCIIVDPDREQIEEYQEKAEAFARRQKELESLSHLPAVTSDGRSVKVCANVGSIEDVKNAIKNHIDGIGLFRSEFLYMENSHFPTEEEQFAVYKEAAELVKSELIIRTLDIGGDKELPYYEFEKEENPFLGWRAIRISLEMEDMFKDQLRALLRASAFGDIRIMYPMIISMEELNKANELLEVCKLELKAEGVAYKEDIKVGMMIETPASVMCVEEFAAHVDFFSIGTNDLTQYILAVDRGNKKIASRYNTFHPAVLKAIQRIIQAGHAHQIPVGMCGEFASDEKATEMLLGMGLDEFSISAGEVANIKNVIRNSSYEEAKQTACKAVSVYTIQDVMDAIQ